MSDSYFIVDKTRNVLSVTINRPEKRNALSREALAELEQIFKQHSKDPDLVAAVLTSAGDKSFAAGGDLQDFDLIRSEEDASNMSVLGFNALQAIKQFPVPVIAAVNGVALGGGAELALACDFRIAAAQAKIGFIQCKLGLSSSWGGSIYLAERIGSSNALQLLATGQVLEASSALALSVVDQVCEPNESLEEKVAAFINPMQQASLQGLRAAKTLAIKANSEWIEPLRESEHQLFVKNWVSDEHWQRAASALDK